MTNWGRLGVFDLETTGVDVDTSRIVSACIAVIDETGTVIDRWDWLADPGIEIPPGAAAVHGITTDRARAEGRPAVQVVAEVAQTLRVLFSLGMPVVIYNAPYDLTLLDRECRRHQLRPLDNTAPVIDPLVLDKAVDRYRKGKRTLEVTAERYGVSLDDAHDAGADAIAAGRVAQALLAAYPEELGVAASQLHGRQEAWYAEQAASFQNYIRTVKGDEAYLADSSWPVRPAEHPRSMLDTQPIPAPAPRPSLTVPVVDLYGTGTLSLEALSAVPAEAVAAPFGERVTEASAQSAYASAPPPSPKRKPTVLRVAAGIITDAEGRVLLVRRTDSSAFTHPGGTIESGESALDALSRELRRAIGLELDLGLTEYLGSFRLVAADEPDTVTRAEVFALATAEPVTAGPLTPAEVDEANDLAELVWVDDPDSHGLELAALTRDTILPLWAQRRSSLF